MILFFDMKMYAAVSKFLAYRFPAVLLKLQCKDLQLPPRTMNLPPSLSYFTSLYLILLTLLESFASSAPTLLLLFSHLFPFFLRASSSELPRAASLLTGYALPRSLTRPHALSFSCAGCFQNLYLLPRTRLSLKYMCTVVPTCISHGILKLGLSKVEQVLSPTQACFPSAFTALLVPLPVFTLPS